MRVYTRFIVIIFIFQNVVADDNIMKKVKELENEKKELYNQINAAIEDSVRAFRKSNDSESITGLKYMDELKKHITNFNKTDNASDDGIDPDFKSDLENRRKFSFTDFLNPKKKKADHDPFNLETILRPKKTSETEWKKIVENRMKVQMKLDDWILQRQKERDRLKEQRLQKKKLIMAGKYEPCPRFGYSNYKKDLDFRGEEEKDGAIKKISRKIKYPCCRKCCKKSYMGCL